MAATALYLDTSVVLRVVLESSPAHRSRIEAAATLITSRLSLIEAGRALIRLRIDGQASEEQLADAAREIDDLWGRCHIWEITAQVCDAAILVAPSKPLRSLDAIHLATYVLARRQLDDLELLTTDHRLADAARLA